MELSQLASISSLVEQLAQALQRQGTSIATVESCTGGMVAAAFTDQAGSSAWFDRGFVTYSNQAKCDMVGVQAATLSAHGAVSEPVAVEMAEGGCRHSQASCAVAITGIAGPGGATSDKPLGMVCFAWAGFFSDTRVSTQYFKGNRAEVRAQSLRYVIEQAISLIGR